MKITSTEKYTLLLAQTDFDTFYKEISTVLENYNNQNIILDFSNINATEAQINSLSKIAETQAENQKSFAVIIPKFDADEFEEELNVVPTLTEAEDIIDMDKMTRDLGF